MITDLDRLSAGASALGVPLTAEANSKLVALLDLLAKWNAVYNLTALQTRDEWIALHILDSLTAVPHVAGERCLDVGTGAGFPGLPLAIANPQQRWTLVDSTQKKAAFVAQAVAELGLPNVEVRRSRIEHFQPAQLFDAVISRAFADLGEFTRLAGHLVTDGGHLIAMKGRVPTNEIEALPRGFRINRIVPLRVPEVEADRHLILLQTIRNQE